MKSLKQAFSHPGVLGFGSVALLTVAGTFCAPYFRSGPGVVPVAPPIVVAPPVALPVPGIPGEVNVRARLAQTKVAQSAGGKVMVELGIETPRGETTAVANERPTDMIIVLDRSGSMADQHKMDYAKSAIHELVNRMGERDRIALVSFDDYARVDVALTNVTDSGRALVHQAVNNIYPGNSTNISSGFDLANGMLSPNGERSVRVLLLSDGVANSGTSSQEGLTAIARGLAARGAVVSTIGLGADYNQQLLAGISDGGMGNYNYLESLEALGRILDADLRQSRAQYASASELTLQLGEGVTLDSTGDYSFVPGNAPGEYKIQTGQLLGGGTKTVTLTLTVPSAQPREIELARAGFTYVHDGRTLAGRVIGDPLHVSVVERESDAIASMRQDVYQKSWIASNVGRAKEAFAQALASGDKNVAYKKMQEMRDVAAAAAPQMKGFAGGGSGAGGALSAVKEAEAEMQTAFDESFTGNAALDAANQNLKAKSMHAGARALQRGE